VLDFPLNGVDSFLFALLIRGYFNSFPLLSPCLSVSVSLPLSAPSGQNELCLTLLMDRRSLLCVASVLSIDALVIRMFSNLINNGHVDILHDESIAGVSLIERRRRTKTHNRCAKMC
jgi:hypothetical protein